MSANSRVPDRLSELLTDELISMDQYFVLGRVFDDWGYQKLAERFSHESDDERGHADKLIRRILFLRGKPTLAARSEMTVGADVKEIMTSSLEFELKVAKGLNDAIALCREEGDNGTRELLAELLYDTEMDHIFWLEQQLHMIKELGVENYLQEQL